MKHITIDELSHLPVGEGLILQGCGGPAEDWFNGINELMTEEGILLNSNIFKDVYIFEYGDLTNILFSMDDVELNIGKRAMWRLSTRDNFGGVWLSDYFPNTLGINWDEWVVDESLKTSLADIEVGITSRSKPLLAVKDIDNIPTFLQKLYAVTGIMMRESIDGMNALAALRSTRFLLLIDGDKISFAEAEKAYRVGSDSHTAWTNVADTSAVTAFAFHLREKDRLIAGDVFQIDPNVQLRDIHAGEIQPRAVSDDKWQAMSVWDKIGHGTQEQFYDKNDIDTVISRVRAVFELHEKSAETVGESEFLSRVNSVFMLQAENPQADMLRISQDAARGILARGDADVYRLLPSGVEKLSPIDVVTSGGLWYQNNREFAIKTDDLPGLHKWAERTVDEVKRLSERGERKKSQEAEL